MKKLLLLILPIILNGCFKLPENIELEKLSSDNSLGNIVVSEGFNYSTTNELKILITILDNGSNPLPNVPLELSYLDLESEKIKLLSGVTENDGTFRGISSIPNYKDSLYLNITYVGLVSEHSIAVSSNEVVYTIEGKKEPEYSGSSDANSSGRVTGLYNYIGVYDNLGVPLTLEPLNDYISGDMLELINNNLPEKQPVPDFNPEYITDVHANTVLTDSAEIWITFVHEGAWWRNGFGYYTYPTDNPPLTKDDISGLNIIFPNVSFKYSRGGLQSGNKVHLGKFGPNTSIGWFLVPNGWDPDSQQVTASNNIKYSDSRFNTFSSEEFRSHVVLLNDEVREILLLGFEDISRPWGDNDFNDAVFYITASPFSAIEKSNLVSTKTNPTIDSDNDGVSDINDSYPNDPSKAFNIAIPGENIYGSLAFEDMWPSKGDYDLNDMVIDYNFNLLTNSSNEVVEMIANIKLKAMGAGYKNGFGFEMDLPPSEIETVTGSVLYENIIAILPNGLESGQDKSVIIVFDNGFKVMASPQGGFVNTEENKAIVEPVEFTIKVTFSSPVKLVDFGYAPFNPFIFVNGVRSKEVHLPGKPPTNLANRDLFGSFDDDSKPPEKYYLSKSNLPWAINLPVSFNYPKEKKSVSKAYLKFNSWANNAGYEYRDWYEDLSGYRDYLNIF